MLDTVFVVKDYIAYDLDDAFQMLENKVPNEFLSVTINPLLGNAKRNKECVRAGLSLRLYHVATPEFAVNGMYSFFPAIPDDSSISGFPRPAICLDQRYFNPLSVKVPKGSALRSPSHGLKGVKCQWNLLVLQTREAGLVLGTYAQTPKCRDK